jgi:hypothetical protein
MESAPDGLFSGPLARIDLPIFGAQPWGMGQIAILLQQRSKRPEAVAKALCARAERMRGIALMLSVQDARILAAYADECETEASLVVAPQDLTRAA